MEPIKDFELKPGEMELNGFWLDLGSRVEKDAGWLRIDWLARERLEKLAERGRDILYRDPRDGRLWERTSPAPSMPEGGPPQLRVLGPEAALEKYGIRP